MKPIYINNELSVYAISKDGNVFNTRTMKQLKPHVDSSGHEAVMLYHPGEKPRYYRIHRLVAEAYIPNPNHYPVVNHIDGNPHNNHYKNLEWCTQAYNIIHAYRTGLNASIGVEKAREIIELLSKGYKTRKVAEMCGTTKNTVDAIYYRHAFADISSGVPFPLHPKGCENNNTAILSNAQACEIINVLEQGKVPPIIIAYVYGINKQIVSNIYNCKTWRGIDNPFSGKRYECKIVNYDEMRTYIDAERPYYKNNIDLINSVIDKFEL